MSVPTVLDCDPGHDDAIAMVLALADSGIDLRAVTTVAGNQTVPKTTRNALRILALTDRTDVPVAAGMQGAMVRGSEMVSVPEVHGESGLDGPELPGARTEAVDEHAVTVLRDAAADGPVTVVPVGPLSNIGMALRLYPEITEGIDRIVLMGGAAGQGNYTPSAEYNILADPEAAKMVFESDVPVTMVGLDATREAAITREEIEGFHDVDNSVGPVVAGWLEYFLQYHERQYHRDAVPVHDALAVASLIDEDVLETEHMHVTVETQGEVTTGRTVADIYDVTDGEPNTDVAMGVDRESFIDLLRSAVESY